MAETVFFTVSAIFLQLFFKNTLTNGTDGDKLILLDLRRNDMNTVFATKFYYSYFYYFR